jgi:hypothetical protein
VLLNVAAFVTAKLATDIDWPLENDAAMVDQYALPVAPEVNT